MERRRFVDGLVDLVTFELLEQVAALGTVTAAASAMGITQQAASARLARAERALGVRLVARAVTGATLTEHGGMVLEWAMPVLEAARRAETSLEALRDHDSSIVIAASQTIAEYPLPGWLQTLRASTPSVHTALLVEDGVTVARLPDYPIERGGSPQTPRANVLTHIAYIPLPVLLAQLDLPAGSPGSVFRDWSENWGTWKRPRVRQQEREAVRLRAAVRALTGI